MKIKSITISNILSFPYLENINSALPTIEFKEGINILIGPNGSGKSNLIEILHKLLQTHFLKIYSINESVLNNPTETHAITAITPPNNPSAHLTPSINALAKHIAFLNKDSHLVVEFLFDENDKDNLRFIIQNFDELRRLASKYSSEIAFFNQEKIRESDIASLSSIKCIFQLNNYGPGNQFHFIIISGFVGVQKFIYDYLVYFNLLQNIIELSMNYDKKEWKPLKNTFALIGSTRSYGQFPYAISLAAGLRQAIITHKQGEHQLSTKTPYSSDHIFNLIITKIGQYTRQQIYLHGVEKARLDMASMPLLEALNQDLKLINLKLKIHNLDEHNDTGSIGIIQANNGQSLSFGQFSTGQKHIFYLICSIHGFDLQNGLLFIDEPEMNLHAAFQKKYLQLLKQASKELNIQLVIATHSPVFIDEETIGNTFRFYKDNDCTKIINPIQFDQQQKDLLQILTYTNSARIFFADKVVLVEGASDEYFFKFFFDKYFSNNDESIEIIHIAGKKQVDKWRKFLDKFKIKNYFIGDLDNIQEQGIVSKANYDSMIKQGKEAILEKMKNKFKDQTSDDGKAALEALDKLISSNFEINEEAKSELISLWEYLLGRYASGALEQYFSNYPSKYEEVKNKIDEKYSDRIYILKQGDLEAYIGKSKDKLKNVIDFCKNEDFANKIERSRLNELEDIFKHILEF